MAENGGGGYLGGSSNFTAGTPELGFSGLDIDHFEGKHVEAHTRGINCEVGFVSSIQSQVDHLFALFKDKQNQEKVEKYILLLWNGFWTLVHLTR